MSFASEVKKELLSLEDESKETQKAMLLGILQGSSSIIISQSKPKIVVKSYILSLIQKANFILKQDYDIDTTIKYNTEKNINKLKYYYLEINTYVNEIIKEYNLSPLVELKMTHPLLQNSTCRNAFVRGMFIAKGSINDPRKNCYHFEISCKSLELAQIIQKIVMNSQITNAKIKVRKSSYVVYIKKSEEISSMLALIGAASGVFYFEDSRIFRDFSNMANRVANCDLANVKRTTLVARKQLQMIKHLKRIDKFDTMPVRLQTIALMREEYPESTLEELSEYSSNLFGKKLSKSGISHCFQDLLRYYEEATKKNI